MVRVLTGCAALLALFAAGAVSITNVACAQDATPQNAAIPYEKLVSLLVRFRAIPAMQRNHVAIVLLLRHSDASNHSRIHAWIVSGGQRIDIPVAADGAVDISVRDDWLAQDPIIQTDQPRHSLDIGCDVGLVTPPGQIVPLAYLQDGLAQVNDVMRIGARQMRGYLAQFVVPRVHHVTMTLAGCCGGTVTLTTNAGPSAPTILRQDSAGHIALPDAILEPGVQGTLTASAPITKLDPAS